MTLTDISDKLKNPEFESEVASLTPGELEKRLSDLAKASEEIDLSKEENEDLREAKAQARELGAPYRDAKKAVGLKMKYIIALIKEKGGQ